jgi:hypothetical protein
MSVFITEELLYLGQKKSQRDKLVLNQQNDLGIQY